MILWLDYEYYRKFKNKPLYQFLMYLLYFFIENFEIYWNKSIENVDLFNYSH